MPAHVTTLRGRVDAVILTIRKDEDEAVAALLGTLEPTSGGRSYRIAKLPGAERDLTVALLRLTAQGNGPAQDAARDAIHELEPRMLVLVGIAGAVPSSEFTLGDVMIATRVTDLRTQALVPDGAPQLDVHGERVHKGLADRISNLIPLSTWSASITVPRPSVPLDADLFRGSDGWNKKVARALSALFHDAGHREHPIYITGTVGSSDFLVKDPTALAHWLNSARKVDTVEMEAAGVMEAAARLQATYPVLVVRGTSDIVGYERDPAWTAYACQSAAAFAIALLRSGQIDDIRPYRLEQLNNPEAPHSATVVNNAGATIAYQNISYGPQTVVSVSSAPDFDSLLEKTKALLKKGLVEDAGRWIDDMDRRNWDRMDPIQRARLRALRGWKHALLGDTLSAARDFHNAHDQNPGTERAFTYKCQAWLLQGSLELAYPVATEGLAKFPGNATLRAMLISSAPADVPLDGLLPPTWPHLPLDSAIAVAAGQRIGGTNPALAESLLRRVDKPSDEDSEYWLALGVALATRVDQAERLHQAVPAADRQEVITVLKRAYECLRAPNADTQRGRIALDISQHAKRLNRVEDRGHWLDIAHQLLPSDIDVMTARAQDAYDRGDHAAACALLRVVVASPSPPGRSRLVFAHSLLKSSRDEAIHEAYQVLNTELADSKAPPDDRARAAVLLAEAQIDREPTLAADTISRHADLLGPYLTDKLRLELAHAAGRIDQVTDGVARMMSERHRYGTDDLLDFGQTLGRLRLNEDCVAVLEPIASRTKLTPTTETLINAAVASNRYELVADICSALRTSGTEDARVLDAEAFVLSLRGDLTGALALTQEWMARHPGDKNIRLRLSIIASELGHLDLLPRNAEDLPEPTDSRPELAVPIVQILRAAKQHDEARRFAYANLKRRRRDEWAWKAVTIAGLPDAPLDGEEVEAHPGAMKALAAGPGMAVRIRDAGTTRWIHLEERDSYVAQPDEYGPTHSTTVALTGKHVGEHVEIHKPKFGLPGRTVVIESIMPCFTRAYLECTHSYELHFPDAPWVHSIEIPESIDDLVAMFTASMKERHASIDALLGLYAQDPRISLHMLAEQCGRSVFDVAPFLASQNVTIRAARPVGRTQGGRELLEQRREVVVEATAISTLAMLEMLPHTRDRFAKVWIASETVDRLRVYVRQTIANGASAHLGLESGRLSLIRNDPHFAAQLAERLRGRLTAVETWQVFHENERGLLSSTSWDAWAQVAGAGTAESVHYAKRRSLPLWTDDLAVAAAAEHEGAVVVSTQVVFESLAAIGVIRREESAEIGARLVGLRYVDTRTPPESFLASARIARWDSSTYPLVQHLELVTKAHWPTHAVALVAAEVFKLWWSNALDRTAIDALVVATLIRIAGRADAMGVFRLLLLSVNRQFGLDVIGARHVADIVIGWLATRFSAR